jgi:hypothetical protein
MIALELKVLTPEVFTMMVLWHWTTVTGPALINYLFKSKVVPDAEEITNHRVQVLFSFGNNEKGKSIAISE